MALKASTLKIGDTHSERVAENLSRTQIVQYAGASGDYNPLHTDEIYTTQIAGYPERVRARDANDGANRQNANEFRR